MSSCNTHQQEMSSCKTGKTIDSQKPTSIKHCQDLPEEKNGQVKGTRITEELLEIFSPAKRGNETIQTNA